MRPIDGPPLPPHTACDDHRRERKQDHHSLCPEQHRHDSAECGPTEMDRAPLTGERSKYSEQGQSERSGCQTVSPECEGIEQERTGKARDPQRGGAEAMVDPASGERSDHCCAPDAERRDGESSRIAEQRDGRHQKDRVQRVPRIRDQPVIDDDRVDKRVPPTHWVDVRGRSRARPRAIDQGLRLRGVDRLVGDGDRSVVDE